MRTDAMESFFGGNERAITRMDCTGFQKRNSTGTESASNHERSDVKSPFEKALAEVTAENVAAHRSTAAMKARKEAGNGEGAEKQGVQESHLDEKRNQAKKKFDAFRISSQSR